LQIKFIKNISQCLNIKHCKEQTLGATEKKVVFALRKTLKIRSQKIGIAGKSMAAYLGKLIPKFLYRYLLKIDYFWS
jgi:hypothetical protein